MQICLAILATFLCENKVYVWLFNRLPVNERHDKDDFLNGVYIKPGVLHL